MRYFMFVTDSDCSQRVSSYAILRERKLSSPPPSTLSFLLYLYILDVTELKLSSKLVVKRVSNCWFENKYSVKLCNKNNLPKYSIIYIPFVNMTILLIKVNLSKHTKWSKKHVSSLYLCFELLL